MERTLVFRLSAVREGVIWTAATAANSGRGISPSRRGALPIRDATAPMIFAAARSGDK